MCVEDVRRFREGREGGGVGAGEAGGGATCEEEEIIESLGAVAEVGAGREARREGRAGLLRRGLEEEGGRGGLDLEAGVEGGLENAGVERGRGGRGGSEVVAPPLPPDEVDEEALPSEMGPFPAFPSPSNLAPASSLLLNGFVDALLSPAPAAAPVPAPSTD